MKYLVTGATSGLGRNAVEALLAQGCDVRATGRDETRALSLPRSARNSYRWSLRRPMTPAAMH